MVFFMINIDKIGLHRISNKNSTPSVSLHLYSPPFQTCKTFCEDTGSERCSGKMCYYSVCGKKDSTVEELKLKYISKEASASTDSLVECKPTSTRKRL